MTTGTLAAGVAAGEAASVPVCSPKVIDRAGISLWPRPTGPL